MWSQTVRQKNQSREIIKVGKSSANVSGTRTQHKIHPRNVNYEKMLNKSKQRNYEIRQHTSDKKRKNTHYVLAESST